MKINDRIFGTCIVDEPVLVNLITTPTFQRLKDLNQFGLPDRYYHFNNFSRYDHSIGVMLLLRMLGARLEEQVAGLLHDVSVTALSHIADWVFGKGKEGNEDYHETLHDQFISQTEIADILEQYNFDPKRIEQLDRYPLLERDIPALCADRVEYALREIDWRLDSDKTIVPFCLQHLTTYRQEIVFDDVEAAFMFAAKFLEMQTNHWGGSEAMRRYYLLSDSIQYALKENIVLKDDFLKTDEVIMQKLEASDDEYIQNILQILLQNPLPKAQQSRGEHIKKKFRHVDPPVVITGKRTVLSEIHSDFKTLLAEHRATNEQGLLV